MTGSMSGDQREMRDAEHLTALAERAKQAAYLVTHGAADPLVHLVEHQHGDLVALGHERFDREHDTRKLPARSDPAQRPLGLARIRLEGEF